MRSSGRVARTRLGPEHTPRVPAVQVGMEGWSPTRHDWRHGTMPPLAAGGTMYARGGGMAKSPGASGAGSSAAFERRVEKGYQVTTARAMPGSGMSRGEPAAAGGPRSGRPLRAWAPAPLGAYRKVSPSNPRGVVAGQCTLPGRARSGIRCPVRRPTRPAVGQAQGRARRGEPGFRRRSRPRRNGATDGHRATWPPHARNPLLIPGRPMCGSAGSC